MAKQRIPCPTVLRLLLRYEPETGKLFWRRRSSIWFPKGPGKDGGRGWNTKFADKEAFRDRGTSGYLMGYILGANKTAHRVAWTMTSGEWPKLDVDHIDGDKHNNRLSNLRLATRAQNIRNSGSRKNKSSPFCGVSWDATRMRWMAVCSDDAGRHRYLGRFTEETAAARAYDVAAKQWHGEFAKLNFP